MNNGPADARRRTSISQLLNPVPYPTTPPLTPSPPSQRATPRLHAASWDTAHYPAAPSSPVPVPPPPGPYWSYAHAPPGFYPYRPYPSTHAHAQYPHAHAHAHAHAWPPPPPPFHPHAHAHYGPYAQITPPASGYADNRTPGSSDERHGSAAPDSQAHAHAHAHMPGYPLQLPPGYGAPPHPHAPPHAMYPHYYPPPVMYAPPPHAMHGQPPLPPPPPPTAAPTPAPESGKKHRRASSDDGADAPAPAPARKRARKNKAGAAGEEDGGRVSSTPARARRGSAAKSANVKRTVADRNADAAADQSGSPTSDSGTTASGPLHPELQLARCMSYRYKAEQFPRCVACTRRWAGDTCRFLGIRFFLRDARGAIVGASFVDDQRPDAVTMRFPTRWDRALDKATVRQTKLTVAKALLPALKEELVHLERPGIVCRPRDSDVRATCDTCMTALFSTSWLCRLCGREACAECFGTMRALTEPRAGAPDGELAAQQARREAHAHANPFFLACTRRAEHSARDFSPASRFHRKELREVVGAMERLLKEEVEAEREDESGDGVPARRQSVGPDAGSQTQVMSVGGSQGSAQTPPVHADLDNTSRVELIRVGGRADAAGPAHLLTPPDETDADTDAATSSSSSSTMVSSTSSSTATLCDSPPVHGAENPPLATHPTGPLAGVPSLPTPSAPVDTLSEDAFRTLLAAGTPVVITGLAPRFAEFTPAWFAARAAGAACAVVGTQTEAARKATVGAFFADFGSSSFSDDDDGNGSEPVKLKDWPSPGGFRAALPELWDALQREMPFGAFCRRDGVFNLASHFPGNVPAPELGPKLYCATATSTAAGSRGSMRLHLDTADSVNVLVHCEGGAGAVWDLFRAEDAPKVRRFLRRHLGQQADARLVQPGYGTQGDADPILAGNVYVDDAMRRALWEECGVRSHRLVQREGEAVFIPAGVAHQVANRAACIKVALDFVSADNVARCEQLLGAFRAQNRSMAWREDSLQLQTMMWFAWLSCARHEADADADQARWGLSDPLAL